jgi:cell division protein FtsI/penicillin-binding protein 2
MNVKTGGILGMVSLGNFDLNNYQIVSDRDMALIEEASEEDRRELLNAGETRR